MDIYTQLSNRLGQVYSNPDSWYDGAKSEAGGMLDELSDAEWLRLQNSWRNQSIDWRVHFAEASFLSVKPRTMGLLVDMLSSDEPQVGAAVAEALFEKEYKWSPEHSIRAHLERHLKKASSEEQIPIKKLMAYVPT